MAKQLDLFEDKVHTKWFHKVMRGEGVRRLPWCKCYYCASEFFDDGKMSKRKSCPFCKYRGMK